MLYKKYLLNLIQPFFVYGIIYKEKYNYRYRMTKFIQIHILLFLEYVKFQ